MRSKPKFDGEIYRRSSEAIAHGALTNSKRPESFVKGIYPTHLTRGLGAKVWDTFGNEYVDHIGGLGANLLGYAQEDVTEAIRKQAGLGATLSLGTELEIKTAEKVKELCPFIERLRFLKTGNEATTAALLIARVASGKSRVYCEGYHGWAPEFTALTPPAKGVVPQLYIHSFKKIHEISPGAAAVIVEPIITDVSPSRVEWLKHLRSHCDEIGALLIFDEIITGFRWPSHSFSQASGITPDLICLGKAAANGMPLGIVGGKAEIMESDYFVSSTFAGETLSLAAALKTMELLQSKFKIDLLWEKGERFLKAFNSFWNDIQLEGYPTRSRFIASDLTKALFMQEACRANILVGPSFFFNYAHIEHMDETLSTFKDILGRIQRQEVKLSGEMPQAAYATKVRNQ